MKEKLIQWWRVFNGRCPIDNIKLEKKEGLIPFTNDLIINLQCSKCGFSRTNINMY